MVTFNRLFPSFLVPLKAILSAKPFLYKNDFDFHQNETACRNNFDI